jgi:hypothetical protein
MNIFYSTFSPSALDQMQRDIEGRLKLDLTRYYKAGKCHLVAYALRRGYRHTLEKEWVVKMFVPRDMPKAEMRQALDNLAPLAGMHLGTDYIVRSKTAIKGT